MSRAVLVLLLAASVGRAWDIELHSTVQLDAHSTSATGLFDLDGDNVPEMLVPGNRLLYCFDTAGTERWRFEPASQYFPAVSSPLAADIDNDGETDVVVATPLAVYRLTADGDSVWRRTLGGQGAVQNCIASCALGDINGDSMLEVFCYEVYANRLLCLDPETGSEVWSYHPGQDARFSVGTPTVADLDRDGRPEVLGLVTDSSGGRTYCLNDSGRELWKFKTAGSGLIGWQLASVAVADVDYNDSLEVIGTANYWGIFCLNCRGETLWTRRYNEHAATYPAIGNVDDDADQEVLTAFGPAMVCLDARTGTAEWEFSVTNGYYIVSSPCLCDLDGDFRWETVFAEVKQSNPNDSLRPMWVLDYSGAPVWFDTVGTTMSDPVAADLDQDGRMEFCIGPTYRGWKFWRFETDIAAVARGAVQWPTLQHDIWRTGWYDFQGPGVGLAEGGGGPIRLPGPAVSIRPGVYETTGRRVRELAPQSATAGRDALQGLPAGCYFISTGGRTRKVLKPE